MRRANSGQHLNSWAEWFDLDKQFEYMDGLGHQVDVVCSIGPFSVSFSDMPVEEGRDYALMWNEEMAGAQLGAQIRGQDRVSTSIIAFGYTVVVALTANVSAIFATSFSGYSPVSPVFPCLTLHFLPTAASPGLVVCEHLVGYNAA